MALTSYPRAFALVSGLESEGLSLVMTADESQIGLQGPATDAQKELVRAFLGQHEGRQHSPNYRAMVRMLRAPTLAVRELLTLPVRFLGSYPVTYTARGTAKRPATIEVVSAKGAQLGKAPMTAFNNWAWSTSRAGFNALIQEPLTSAFTAKELERAAYALEHGRAGPSDMAKWCGAKAGRDWVLTPELARAADLRGYREGETFSSLVVGELLDGLDAELTTVEWKDGDR